jgi:iron complex outermembrane recepter protein
LAIALLRSAHFEGEAVAPKRLPFRTLCLALLAAHPIATIAQQPSVAQQTSPDQPASDTSGPALQEVVVTAERRQQNLQHAPVSVTAVSGEQIRDRDVTAVSDLTQLVPALEAYTGSGPYSNITLRGVSSLVVNSFGDPAIAVNMDGVYLARTTAFEGLFYDVQRVEVLKGPQGTLYGRNATGGAINVISNSPTFDFSGNFSAQFGNYSDVTLNGDVNAPLASNAAVRLAFQTVKHDGYFDDGTGDQDQQSGRLSFRVDPASDLSMVIRADYTRQAGRGQGATLTNADGSFLGTPWTSDVTLSPALVAGRECPLFPFPGSPVAPCRPLPTDSFQDNHYWGVSGDLEWSVLGGQFTFIPAYRSDHYDFLSPAAGFMIRELNDAHQISMEARFASSLDHPLSYIAGVYYFDGPQAGDAQYDAQANGATSVQYIDNGDRSWAGYGQLTWALSRTVRLTAGVRYTYERKETDSRESVYSFFYPAPSIEPPPQNNLGIAFPTTGEKSWNATNWKAGAEWDVGPQSLLYANVATGFKSGGFFLNVPGDPRGNTYNPEHVTAYTIGSKNLFLERRLQLNLEVFDLEYTDQQVAALELAQFGPGFLPIFPNQNAGRSRNRGAELDSQWLATTTTVLSADIQYMHARYTDFTYISSAPPSAGSACAFTLIPPTAPVPPNFRINCSGLPLLQAPEWVANLGLEQTIPLGNSGELVAEVNTQHESDRETDVSYVPASRVGSYWITNLALTFNPPGRRWSITGYVNNVSDAAVPDSVAPSSNYPTIPTIAAVLKPPRTYGVRGAVHF